MHYDIDQQRYRRRKKKHEKRGKGKHGEGERRTNIKLDRYLQICKMIERGGERSRIDEI